MADEDIYHVVVQGVEFELARSQVEFDSPNYFSTSFLGDFRESRTRRVKIARDPGLFKIIIKYLTGYQVLPLSYSLVPSGMTTEAALANLRADATYYQLDGLVHAIDAIGIPYVETMKPDERYLAFLGVDRILRWASLVDGVRLTTDWTVMPLTPDRQLKPPFNELDSPESAATFDELLLLSVIQGVLKSTLGKRYRNHWKLVGYKVEHVTQHSTSGYQTTILVERSM
ncbi:hypothetical protein ACGC1H_000323 [Rhizoctonia solani]|uniref:BTB domain-containing protein n=1 Tax=Rhizoctonia solani TaxID=456999 RepID=A0A8H2WXP4_9AGAM|nr:unnamed protein product [Rhizoctonia solani]